MTDRGHLRSYPDAGVASATVNTMQQIGGSVGTALLSTFAASAASSYAASHATATDAVAQAAVHGYTTAFWWSAAIFAAGAIVCGLLMRPGHAADRARRRARIRPLSSRSLHRRAQSSRSLRSPIS